MIDRFIEVFKDFDLNDDTTIFFNDCKNELINRIKEYELSITNLNKEIKSKDNEIKKEFKLKDKYKKAYYLYF